MKKSFSIFMLITLGITLMCSPAMASSPDFDYVKLVDLTINEKAATVNGTSTSLDQPAFVKSGRTLVPFRFLAESLGAQVTWDGATSTAGLTLKDKAVKVTLGSKNAYINGQLTTLDVPAESVGGRTFIPLRFVSEALGAKVDYDAQSQGIKVALVDTTGWASVDFSGKEILYPSEWAKTGDGFIGITVLGPEGIQINVLPAAGDPNGDLPELTNLKSTIESQGFDYFDEIEIGGFNGTAALFAKMNMQDTYNSDVRIAGKATIAGAPYIIEVTAKYPNLDAVIATVEKMLLAGKLSTGK